MNFLKKYLFVFSAISFGFASLTCEEEYTPIEEIIENNIECDDCLNKLCYDKTILDYINGYSSDCETCIGDLCQDGEENIECDDCFQGLCNDPIILTYIQNYDSNCEICIDDLCQDYYLFE
ncbi:MAG: hypothetical protein ABIF40_00855 [archaeon]